MQTSLDLPSQLGVVETSSIPSLSKITNGDYEQQMKEAIKRCEEDKLFRKSNVIKDVEELEAVEVQNGEQKSLIYYYKATQVEEHKIQQEAKEDPDQLRPRLGMMEGILQKKSPHWFQGYQPRNCLLKNRVFRYYNVENKKLQGVLNFDVQSFQFQEMSDKNGNVIEFLYKQNLYSLKPLGNTQKVFQFKGNNQEETKAWSSLIKQHLQDSRGAKRILHTLTMYDKFWRFERISPQQIYEDADDGDILLFSGKDINCHIQRAFTQSSFDHMGMFIRLDNHQLYLFEALPLHGVGLCRWSKFVSSKWHTLYNKIIYRELQVIRNDDFRSKIHEFITDNLGKQYSIAPSKLFKFKSTMLDNVQEQQKLEQQRTYFCSELVAACYKYLNLLPKNISSAQYWPGTFSNENSKFSLIYGNLSVEYLIDFEAD